MSRSAIFMINTTSGTAISAGGTYPITQVVRRFGCDLKSNGSGISAVGSGYYKVQANIAVVATAAGTINATLYNNGIAVPGATATVTATEGGTVTLPIDSIVRVNCCGNTADLTVVISAAATTVNAEMSAFKL